MSDFTAYIGLGSNVGDREATLSRAIAMIDDAESISIVQTSTLIETQALGGPAGQRAYINGVSEIKTSLAGPKLLERLQCIEASLGRDRTREISQGPRTCDLDILLMGDIIIETDELTIPHPRMHLREFVLKPLAEIAPDVVHPVRSITVKQMLDQVLAQKSSSPTQAKLVSIIGPVAVGKTTLADGLARELPATEVLHEDYRGNPFIADSYDGQVEADLPCQLYFLLSRAKQLALSTWPAEGLVVADYGFCQDAIYAQTFLAGKDIHAYNQAARRVINLIRQPDVLISLDAGESTLLDRIAKRGRGYEETMTREFLSGMRCAYHDLNLDDQAPEVIEIDCEAVDFRDIGQLGQLADRIREVLAKLVVL